MKELQRKIQERIDSFPGRAGLALMHREEKRTIIINGEQRFHAASIIKVPILYEALQQVGQGRLELAREYQLPQEEKVGGAGVLNLLHSGLNLSLADLLHLMIVISDNTATNMLIDIAGRENVNKTLDEIGCPDTFLARKLMRPVSDLYSYTSALDTVGILDRIYEDFFELGMPILRKQQFNDCLSRDIRVCKKCKEWIGSASHCPKCRSAINQLQQEKVVFAHKTGEINGVVHDAGIWELPGATVIIALLTDQLPDNRDGKFLQARLGADLFQFFS